MDMQVYVANLGRYNEGELVGAWFTPPISEEEMAEKIGLHDEYEEYAIHDYQLPFEISEYISIRELNRLCEAVSELDDLIQEELTNIQGMWFSSLDELLENAENIHCYSDCDSMEDLAQYLIEETGVLGDVPDSLKNYIDYQAYGRDLSFDGCYLVTSHGVFEYTG
jgi:antirestriction protein